MKHFKFMLLCAFAITVSSVHAAWGIWQTYAVVNNGGSDLYLAGNLNADGATSFEGYYLGTFNTGGNLTVKGGETKTFKNGGDNVCQGTMFYRVYRICDTPGAYTPVTLSFQCEFPNPGCVGIGGTAGNQKWGNYGQNTNIVAGLTLPGTYVLEVYFMHPGTGPGGPCDAQQFDSNAPQNNFKAYFDFNVTDSFSDLNETASPVWSGNDLDFSVVNNSDAGAWTAIAQSRTLRLTEIGPGGFTYLSSQISNWGAQQEWYFWMGFRDEAASNSNTSSFWLYANESNLQSATVDGYRITIGDNTGGDEVRLERVNNGTATTIFASSQEVTNNINYWGLAFKVVRTQSGRWSVVTSSMPTVSNSGAAAYSCPATVATNTLTDVGTALAYVDDITIVPAANGYLGVSTFNSSLGLNDTQEFDNIRFVAVPPDTYVSITSSSATISEDVGGGTHTISVNINNASSTTATTVQLNLVSGPSARINGFTTQTLTFPAGSSTTQNVVLTITNNEDCDDIANLSFALQNVSGGLNAYISTPSTYALTINDDNMGYETLLNDDFEDANMNGWTAVGAGTFAADNSAPATGAYSLQHVNAGSAGSAHVYHDLDGGSIAGLASTWRFNVKTFLNEPTGGNEFLIFLAANETNLYGTTVDGYAVGVNPINIGDPDYLTLWRVDNGVPTLAIAQSSLDWGNTLDKVGIEVTRDENGNWALRYDSNGNFDNLILLASGTELTYADMNYFGARYSYGVSTAGEFSLDDVYINQKGCRTTLYSRATGNNTDAIWSTQPSGLPAPTTVNAGRYTRLVIQSPHVVSFVNQSTCNDISVNAGATMNINASNTLKVYGIFLTEGTLNSNTSTVTMKGGAAQSFLGASKPRFYNLTIDNDFGTVSIIDTIQVAGVVGPVEGTFQTNGKLVLASNASSTGSIGTIPLSGSDVVGNITIQRFIPAALQNWVNIGAPITGQTLAQWNDDLVTTGFPGSDFPPPYSFVNIQYYNETLPGDRNQGWTPITNIANTLLAQRGYSVYMAAAANTVDLTGPFIKGAYTLPLSFTNTGNAADGWNLVANVYPSEVDFVQLEGASSDVALYYVFDSQLGQGGSYRSYNANTGLGTASRYIPSSQSFFVRALNIGQSLNFQESHKSATNAAFERSLPESQFIRFQLFEENLMDEGVLSFNEGATNAYEAHLDGEKWHAPNEQSPEFALVAEGGELLTLDARAALTNELSIPVYMEMPYPATYTFTISEMQNIPAGVCVKVEDLVTGEWMNLEVGEELAITVEEAFVGNRLMIHVSTPAQITSTDAVCFGSNNGMIDVVVPGDNWSYIVINEMGATVYSNTVSALVENVAAGAYTVAFTNTLDGCGSGVIDVTIAQPALMTASFVSSMDECNMSNNASIEFLVNDGDEYTFELIGSEGNMVMQGTSAEMYQAWNNLSGDVYTLAITNGCTTVTEMINVKDPNAVTTDIVTTSTELEMVIGQSVEALFNVESITATNHAWLVNGVEVGSGSELNYTFNATGEYTIEVTSSNATCSSHDVIIVVVDEVVSVSDVAGEEAVVCIPMNGGYQLTFNTVSAQRSTVEVFNTLGQQVMVLNDASAQGQTMFVDLNALAEGAYTLRVVNNKEVVFTQQVVR